MLKAQAVGMAFPPAPLCLSRPLPPPEFRVPNPGNPPRAWPQTNPSPPHTARGPNCGGPGPRLSPGGSPRRTLSPPHLPPRWRVIPIPLFSPPLPNLSDGDPVEWFPPPIDPLFFPFPPPLFAPGVDPTNLHRLIPRTDRWAEWCRNWCRGAHRPRDPPQKGARARSQGHGWRGLSARRDPLTSPHTPLRRRPGTIPHRPRPHSALLSRGAPPSSPPHRARDTPATTLTVRISVARPARRAPNRAPSSCSLPPPPGIARPERDSLCARGLATRARHPAGGRESAPPARVSPIGGREWRAERHACAPRHTATRAVSRGGHRLSGLFTRLCRALRAAHKARVPICAPCFFARALPQLPEVSQELFGTRSHAATRAEAQEIANRISLEDCASQINFPLLIVFGAGDRIVPPAEGERLARAASGPTDFVVYEEGNHVCFNISYKFRPLTADWTVEHL